MLRTVASFLNISGNPLAVGDNVSSRGFKITNVKSGTSVTTWKGAENHEETR
jgi:hypothetical protein